MMYLKPLLSKLILNKEVLKEARLINNDKDMLDLLLKQFPINKIEEAFSKHYGVKYTHLDISQIDKSLLGQLDKNLLKKQSVIPYAFENNTWHFAISDLINGDVRKAISKLTQQNGQQSIFTFAFKHEIDQMYRDIEGSKSLTSKPRSTRPAINQEDFNAGDWVSSIINKGIDLNASDIHIEKLEHETQVRYRVDGVMTGKELFNFDESVSSNIYVRLKIISNMDIAEKRKAQDGIINNYKYRNKLYDLRVSSVSTIYGEKFVMRLFNRTDKIPSFKALGFSDIDENKINQMMSQKSGIIYLAGATGSGKTTTLYTMIEGMDKELLNIYTIENPVEKTLKNVNQIQIDEPAGITYPSVLRALLRQDPDVIVVGEIRDAETAELSIRASLTGHLVITTIHANSAIDSLSRLTDMGMESYLIGASSIGFLSQRLVRKLCPHCKQKVEHLQKHEELWVRDEIKDFDYEEYKKQDKYIYKNGNCDKCISGYKGRVALVETILINDELKNLISAKASIAQILEYVRSNDINKTLKYDGITKLTNGIISIDELMGQIMSNTPH